MRTFAEHWANNAEYLTIGSFWYLKCCQNHGFSILKNRVDNSLFGFSLELLVSFKKVSHAFALFNRANGSYFALFVKSKKSKLLSCE